MQETARLLRTRRETDPAAAERKEILDSMCLTRKELNMAYANFNAQSDPDLIDASVYEINALRSRYSYLARRLKELEHKAAGSAV